MAEKKIIVAKAGLIDIIQKKEGLKKRDAAKMIDIVISAIETAFVEKDADTVRFLGFGSLKKVRVPEREGRNPQTGEKMVLPAHARIKFSAGSNLKQAINW